MKIPGKRVKIPRWVHTDDYVVRVEVEAVIPDADPSEPCLEAETMQWLCEIRRHADEGDTQWLANIGELYVKQPA